MTHFQSPFAEMFFQAASTRQSDTALVTDAFARTGRPAALRTGRKGSRRTSARRQAAKVRKTSRAA